MVSRLGLLTALLLIVGVSNSNADDSEVYKHRDSTGAVLYSDSPIGPGGSRTEKLPTTPMTVIAAPATSDSEMEGSALPGSAGGYEQLRIVSPAAQQTVRSNNGDLTVVIDSLPVLRPGDTAVVLLDGAAMGSIRYPDTSVTLVGVERGEHSLQVVVLGSNQQLVQQSGARSFYLHRFSAITAPR